MVRSLPDQADGHPPSRRTAIKDADGRLLLDLIQAAHRERAEAEK
jgi:hypothetical protein